MTLIAETRCCPVCLGSGEQQDWPRAGEKAAPTTICQRCHGNGYTRTPIIEKETA